MRKESMKRERYKDRFIGRKMMKFTTKKKSYCVIWNHHNPTYSRMTLADSDIKTVMAALRK